MAAHRLIEIEGGAARRIEACQPHRTDENQAELVLRILELRFQILFHHTLTVRQDIEAPRLHLGDLVLPG